MTGEREVFRDRLRKIGTIGSHTAQENKLLHNGILAVGLGHGLHDARRAGTFTCHMASRSRIPVRTGSITNAK